MFHQWKNLRHEPRQMKQAQSTRFQRQFRMAPNSVRDYVKKVSRPSPPPEEISPGKSLKEHWRDMNKSPKHLRHYHSSHFNIQDGEWQPTESHLSEKSSSQIRRASKIVEAFNREREHQNEVNFVHENRMKDLPSSFTNAQKFKRSQDYINFASRLRPVEDPNFL